MGIYSDNFYSWLDRQHDAEKLAMDSETNGYIHPDGNPCRAASIKTCPKFKDEVHELEDAEVAYEKIEERQGKTEKEMPKTSHTGYRALRDALAKSVSQDGTYDLATGKPKSHTDGYQVSFQEETTERKGYDAYISDDEYDRKVEALKKELGVEPDLGRFGEPEISFHVASRDKALELARRFNQESVYDWSTHGTTYECIANPDFVGERHYADYDNHKGRNYHEQKPNTTSTTSSQTSNP